MEVSGRRKEKDDDDHTTGILCDPCRRVNEEENAIFFCTVCNEFLCDTDAKAHRKSAASSTHQLLDRNSMPKQKIGSHQDNICQKHSGKILEYYCNSHNTNCCTVCVTKEHRHCEVEFIDDIAKGYEQSSEYKSLIKDMTDLTQRLHTVKQQSLNNKSNAQRLHSEIISEIRKFRVEINSILDSLESASLEETKWVLDVDSNAAESTTTHCDSFMAKLKEITSSMDKFRQYKQERQLVMYSKNAGAQVKDIEDEVSKLPDPDKNKDYKFIPDKAIPQLLRSLKSLGHLEVTEERSKSNENDQRATMVSGAEVSIPVINQPVALSHVRDINIRHSTDTDALCWISGGVMLDQTKLVLADRRNASAKVVDVINNTVISCIKIPSGARDITRVEKDQVVVSCNRGKVVFLKVGKTLSIVKELDLGGRVWGITHTNNSLFVGFDSPDSCVKVIDLKGKTLKTFKTDAAGNNLFKRPGYIALSEDQNTIFVSDWGNNRVTSLRMDGTVRGVYTDDSLSCPRGLAVDRNDNVYVAGSDSHNIHQLSTECKPIKVLLDSTHGIKYPWMVTYCKEEHKLYIGYQIHSGKNYELSVFQLK